MLLFCGFVSIVYSTDTHFMLSIVCFLVPVEVIEGKLCLPFLSKEMDQ